MGGRRDDDDERTGGQSGLPSETAAQTYYLWRLASGGDEARLWATWVVGRAVLLLGSSSAKRGPMKAGAFSDDCDAPDWPTALGPTSPGLTSRINSLYSVLAPVRLHRAVVFFWIGLLTDTGHTFSIRMPVSMPWFDNHF
jgi:hypothetical protein